MADRAVTIFTFTETEAAAVEFLLNSYIDRGRSDSPPWHVPRLGEKRIVRQRRDGLTVQIEHTSLLAQGNVSAGAALAGAAADALADPASRGGDDYYVFYGCCGVLDEAFVGQAFRVSRVAYMSLGSVTNLPASEGESGAAGASPIETVRLKNKWFVRTDPDNQPPLSSVFLPLGSKERSGKLMHLNLPEAFVLATDKVIKVAPTPTAPACEWSDPAGGAVYRQEE